jgi:hypothetical protein
MGIDVSHLVFEALRDTDNQVVNQGSDCAESSDILASAVVQLNIDDVFLWVRKIHREMTEVLAKLAFGDR